MPVGCAPVVRHGCWLLRWWRLRLGWVAASSCPPSSPCAQRPAACRTGTVEARLSRMRRALKRGFTVKKDGWHDSCVAVAPVMAPRVRAVAASLTLYAEPCLRAGAPSHAAAVATHVAAPHLAPDEVNRALQAHWAYSAAKHRWAPLFDVAPPFPSARARCIRLGLDCDGGALQVFRHRDEA